MATGYDIHPEILKTIDYKILVLTLPKNDLEDLLTHFVGEHGKISKSLYEDFLIANSIANLNQFMTHIQDIIVAGELDLIALRNEIISLIIKHNPALDPDNIVINSNKILKLKTKDDDKTVIPLTKNSYWNKLYYDENGNYKPISKKDSTNNHINNSNKKDKVDKRDISELSWQPTQVFWDRLNEYIIIKKYKPEDIDCILTQRFFHNSTSFNTYIVQNCIANVEDIYASIDGMGVNVDPNKIIRELFQLCISVNKNISYKRAKELNPVDNDDVYSTNNTTTQRSPYNRNKHSNKKNKTKFTFKQIPKTELLALENNMKVSLVGQDEAINKISEAIKRASVGLKDPIKPIGSFLFTGKTGCGKCVEENSLIFSRNGIKPIKDFYIGTKKQEQLKVNLSTISGEEETEFIYKEGRKLGRVIETSIGNKLGGSMVHPVVTIDNSGEIKFKRFNELIEGDYVGIQYNQNYFSNKRCELPFIFDKHKNDSNSIKYKIPIEMNEDLAYYIGLLTGDGCLTINNRVIFSSADKQLVRSFYLLSEKLFGINVKIASDKYSYYYESVYIYQFLKNACKVSMDYARNKTIPSTILESTGTCIKAFIQGLMDTDGYYEHNRKAIGITLCSKKLIEDLQVVLFNFGVINSIRYRKVKYNDEFKDAYTLSITGRFVDIYFNNINFRLRRKADKQHNRLGVISNQNRDIIPNIASKLKIFCNDYTFDNEFYQKYGSYIKGLRRPSRIKLNSFLKDVISYVGDEVKNNNLYTYFNSFIEQDIFWASITNIEEKELELYDFTVPGSHTFISNGFISHNTLASKVLADELIKTRKNRVVIDCSEYSSDHEYAKLIGAPAGYIGYENGGILTNAIAENPFSVIVFDEIEKASTKIYDLMLQILDEGRLTDGKGKSVSFKDTIIIMTSNVGVAEIDQVEKTIGFGDVAVLTETKKSNALDNALKERFKPEFLNRIDAIIHFRDLKKDDYMKIIDIELYKLKDYLKMNNTEYKDITLNFDNRVKNLIYRKGVDTKFGARPIKRAIEKFISTKIAEVLLNNEYSANVKINVTTKKGKVYLKINDHDKEKKPSILLHTKQGA